MSLLFDRLRERGVISEVDDQVVALQADLREQRRLLKHSPPGLDPVECQRQILDMERRIAQLEETQV